MGDTEASCCPLPAEIEEYCKFEHTTLDSAAIARIHIHLRDCPECAKLVARTIAHMLQPVKALANARLRDSFIIALHAAGVQ